MTLAWDQFTPYASLGGGALIGLAAVLLIMFNGRIAGISGVLGGLLRPPVKDAAWRLAFIAGLLVAPLLYAVLVGLPEIRVEASVPTLIAAGLLVGIGTRYGSGCTSGHGVCGLSRLSPRSLAATLLFMGAGFATVFIVRHVLGGPT